MHVEVCTTASAAWAGRCHLTTLGGWAWIVTVEEKGWWGRGEGGEDGEGGAGARDGWLWERRANVCTDKSRETGCGRYLSDRRFAASLAMC